MYLARCASSLAPKSRFMFCLRGASTHTATRYDTCCRSCATSPGAGIHDAECVAPGGRAGMAIRPVRSKRGSSAARAPLSSLVLNWFGISCIFSKFMGPLFRRHFGSRHFGSSAPVVASVAISLAGRYRLSWRVARGADAGGARGRAQLAQYFVAVVLHEFVSCDLGSIGNVTSRVSSASV